MVTFSGSPPKRWMFSLTHSRAATTSNIPTFAEYAYCSPKSDKSRYPSTFNRWLTDTNTRSEEHTSELQSRGQIVCRLLLEKKKRVTDDLCRATIESYDPTEDSQIKAKKIATQYVESFDATHSLLCSGDCGLGRSHSSVAIT